MTSCNNLVANLGCQGVKHYAITWIIERVDRRICSHFKYRPNSSSFDYINKFLLDLDTTARLWMAVIQRTLSLSTRRRLRKEKVVVSGYSLTSRKQWFTVSVCLRLTLLIFILVIYFLAKSVGDVRRQRASSKRKLLIPYAHPDDQTVQFAGSKKDGVSIVAACQNGHEQLRAAFATWIKVRGVNEILLVDWRSQPALKLVVEEIDIPIRHSPAVRVIRVENQRVWRASWAFNVGFSLMHYDSVLKINCDHHVEPDFIDMHPVSKNNFYAGAEHLERSNDEMDLRNIIYTRASQIRQVGGFDERLQDNGGEQEDLISRLLAKGLSVTELNYDSFHHKLSETEKVARVESRDTMKQLEKKVNIGLLNQLPKWNVSIFTDDVTHSERISHAVMSFQHSNVEYVSLQIPSDVISVRYLVEKDQITKEREIVTSGYLSDEFMIPSCLSGSLTLTSRKIVIRALEERRKRDISHLSPKTLFLYTFGSTATRLHIFLSALSLSKRTGRVLILLMDNPMAGEKLLFSDISYREQRDVVIADLKDLPAFLSGHSCAYRKRLESIKFYKFTKKSGNAKGVLEDIPDKHFLVQTEIPLSGADLRSVNHNTMKEEFENLNFFRDVSERIAFMDQQGIREALGVHVVEEANLERNSSAKLHVYSSVSAMLKLFRDKEEEMNVFLDGGDVIRDRLSSEGTKFIDFGNVNSGSCVVLRDCIYRDLFRVMALSRTKAWMSFGVDDVTQLVNIIRRK